MILSLASGRMLQAAVAGIWGPESGVKLDLSEQNIKDNYVALKGFGKSPLAPFGTCKCEICREKAAQSEFEGGFRVAQYPGCCGMMIMTGAWVEDWAKRQGHFKKMVQLAEALAEMQGYTVVQGSTVDGDVKFTELMPKLGYKDIHKFRSTRTDNRITVWAKELKTSGD